jgi:hypothetical protein
VIAAADQLREKSRDYELTALADRERNDERAAAAWYAVALALREVAAALEAEEA